MALEELEESDVDDIDNDDDESSFSDDDDVDYTRSSQIGWRSRLSTTSRVSERRTLSSTSSSNRYELNSLSSFFSPVISLSLFHSLFLSFLCC